MVTSVEISTSYRYIEIIEKMVNLTGGLGVAGSNPVIPTIGNTRL